MDTVFFTPMGVVATSFRLAAPAEKRRLEAAE
jgi:hypothetical protein